MCVCGFLLIKSLVQRALTNPSRDYPFVAKQIQNQKQSCMTFLSFPRLAPVKKPLWCASVKQLVHISINLVFDSLRYRRHEAFSSQYLLILWSWKGRNNFLATCIAAQPLRLKSIASCRRVVIRSYMSRNAAKISKRAVLLFL